MCILRLGPLLNSADEEADPTQGRADAILDRVEIVQGQLLLVRNFRQSLKRSYRAFRRAPAEG